MRLKKGIKRFLYVLFILIVIAFIVYYLFFTDGKKKTSKVKVLNEIKEYGYKLNDSKNDVYKKLFSDLKSTLKKEEVDEEEYVKIISKMFIVDFYSLDDKLAKTDVGGTDFVHSDAMVDFLEKAQDTMYKYVESNIYGDRTQSLPSVSDVEIKSVEQEAFTYKENVDDKAYVVDVSWKYTDTSSSNGYQDSATLVFVHEDKKLSLVELR